MKLNLTGKDLSRELERKQHNEIRNVTSTGPDSSGIETSTRHKGGREEVIGRYEEAGSGMIRHSDKG